MPDIVVIVNPASARGKTARQWPVLRTAIEAALGAVRVCTTDAPGHAETLTREALLAGASRIISVGGDGTHHEVANGFWKNDAPINPDAVLGILPHGTGSDFAKTLGLPQGLAALKVLAEGRVVAADVGRLTCRDARGNPRCRYFINTCHIGIGGAIGDRANTRFKHYGKASFFLATLATILDYRPGLMQIAVDGENWEQAVLDIIIANGQIDGGGMRVAPNAKLNSGVFEFYSIRPLSALEAVLNLHKVYRGELTSRPDLVQYRRAQRISISGDSKVPINIDGESAGCLDAELEILSGALRIIHAANAPGIADVNFAKSAARK